MRDLETRLAEHMPEQHILDMLTDTEHWLDRTSPFGPISGHETKIEDPVVHYRATVFCYGSNMVRARRLARSLGWIGARSSGSINTTSSKTGWTKPA